MTRPSRAKTDTTGTTETSEDTPMTFAYDLGDMDLAAAAARGAELELRHPATGQPIGILIRLAGADSQTYLDAQRRILDLAARDGKRTVDSSVYERRAAELAAAVTMGWAYKSQKGARLDSYERVEGMIPWRGQELPFSDENAINVYLERRWIREQIESFINVRANFFPD